MKIFFLLSLSLITQASYAAEVLCSLKQEDTRYKLNLDSKMISGKEAIHVTILASSISGTLAGEQTQYMVGEQSFEMNLETDDFILNLPVREGRAIQFAKVFFSDEGPEDLTVTVSGPALEKDLTFTNCLTAE